VFLNVQGRKKTRNSFYPAMPLGELDDLVTYLQNSTIEHSTLWGYTLDTCNYLSFCKIHNLPSDPTPQTLSHYIAFFSQYIKSGPKYLSGVCFYLRPFFPEFDKNCAYPLVQVTICSAKKIRADSITRKLSLQIPHLQSFADRAATSNSYDDLLFAIILFHSFYNCHHLRELVQNDNVTLFDLRKIIKYSRVFISHRQVSYHLPYHKTDPFYEGTEIIAIP
jgi:hypothetical protein